MEIIKCIHTHIIHINIHETFTNITYTHISGQSTKSTSYNYALSGMYKIQTQHTYLHELVLMVKIGPNHSERHSGHYQAREHGNTGDHSVDIYM